jgi:hypothetical protein
MPNITTNAKTVIATFLRALTLKRKKKKSKKFTSVVYFGVQYIVKQFVQRETSCISIFLRFSCFKFFPWESEKKKINLIMRNVICVRKFANIKCELMSLINTH